MSIYDDFRESVREFFRIGQGERSYWRRVAVSLFFLIAITSIMTPYVVPAQVNLRVGQAAPGDIFASREIEDRVATELRRQAAEENVPKQFNLDPRVIDEIKASVSEEFSELESILDDEALSQEEKVSQLKEQWEADLSDAVLGELLALDTNARQRTEETAKNVLAAVLRDGVKKDDIDAAKDEVDLRVNSLDLTSTQVQVISGVAKALIRPNEILNLEETERFREQARQSVAPVVVQKGQLIVEQGEIVTEQQIAILEDLGLQKKAGDFRGPLGIAFLVLIAGTGIGLYLAYFKNRLFQDDSLLLLLALISTITLLLSFVSTSFSGLLAPVAAGTMLIAVLLDAELAIIMGLAFAFFVGLASGGELRVAFVAMVGGLTGAFAVAKVAQRSDLTRAGLFVGLANVFTIFAWYLVDRQSLYQIVALKEHLWGFVNGLVSAVITIGSLPFLENLFGVITSIRLLELSNPNEPLLQKLLVDAPGTYHHSIIVANLAEAATEAVGGNALMARVGAYYHDVGKTKRPYFFIENQFGQDNPHDKLSPNLSVLIITSHVKDGVEMAEEHDLPQAVIDIIEQHHGTTTVSYFYNRALEGNGEEVVEEDYSYDGPEPQTKEAAILMLADSVEAAVRALSRPTPGRIEGLIRKIIKDRLNDGQLDKSDLTLRDLDLIAKTFARVLSGIFHPRIEYPDYVVEEMKARMAAEEADEAQGGAAEKAVAKEKNGHEGGNQ